MRQLGSNEMDGVNGITECPMAPGQTRVYRFQATQYGTTVCQIRAAFKSDSN
jgi:FtsP/CotA-like multicopper oxidase with cupredoxin domain